MDLKTRVISNGLLVMALFVIVLLVSSNLSDSKHESPAVVKETEQTEQLEAIPTIILLAQPEEIDNVEMEMCPESFYETLSEEETYMLAKLLMAEAENQNVQTKTLIAMVVLNRVTSEDFPNTLVEVVFQKVGKTYQFSPIGDGRYNKVEPDVSCYEAIEVVMQAEYDYSGGALYFESCSGDSWHSRNLEFLYQSEDMKFYK